MATLLDAGILTYFGPIFVVLLVFIIVYGILEYVKPFGAGKLGLHAIIALSVSLLLLMSGIGTNMIKTLVPWFIVGIIFLFFLLLMVRMFNVSEGDLRSIVGRPDVYTWLVIFAILVILASLSAVFGQQFLEQGSGGGSGTNYNASGSGGTLTPDMAGTRSTTTSNFGTNLMNTFRNPKVLGLIFIFLVAAFAMFFLTKSAVS